MPGIAPPRIPSHEAKKVSWLAFSANPSHVGGKGVGGSERAFARASTMGAKPCWVEAVFVTPRGLVHPSKIADAARLKHDDVSVMRHPIHQVEPGQNISRTINAGRTTLHVADANL